MARSATKSASPHIGVSPKTPIILVLNEKPRLFCWGAHMPYPWGLSEFANVRVSLVKESAF